MKKWYSYALCCALAIMLVSCVPKSGGSQTEAGGGTSPQETALDKARREGYVTVGFANEKPYAYATPDGQLTGEARR